MEEVKIEGETGADSFQDTLLSGQLTEFFSLKSDDFQLFKRIEWPTR